MSDLDAKMSNLRDRFLARSSADCSRLKAHLDGDVLESTELRTIVHRLAGAAGIFGYGDISALAGNLDACLATGAQPKALPDLVAALQCLTPEFCRS